MDMQTETIRRRRILLVDDERVMRELLKNLLIQQRHIVEEANNGAEALGLFTRGRFDLVMTDCVMPFMNGDELALRIRQLAPRQPILMMTGYNCRRGRNNPVNAIVYKPLDFDQLHLEMGKLLWRQ
jgi:CheY-like chemotaxis protein